ncbi:MAG TPA: metallophosphoesterase family protein [Saprospiraceae bacterium]|nr:metallophosphoesterase family protein [Saprospiraceae bacterium]HMQ84238.1 metallophosphoesterase family protein [Saprospiraceae bacterium]
MKIEFQRIWIAFIIFSFFPGLSNATSGRYRCTWRNTPATSMVIGWDQISGHSPVVYYDVIDFGVQADAYRFNHQPDRIINSKGMNNHFARLENLKPNTVYFFVIKDSEGTSKRMSFKTAPDNANERLSIIAGGDSRNNRSARCDANRLVSKLRPHFVMFDGDMTGGDTYEEWKEWFDDWQLTIGSDGRIFPVLAARGNHEAANSSITELFDVSNNDVYYALTFGGDLLRVYTLNSMIAPGGNQSLWLEGDLKANTQVQWKFAQYHQAMRPHTAKKPEKDELIIHWAGLFYGYSVNLVLESDAHVVKITYPIRPSNEAGSDEGFIRDDENGTVYMGEGCWGAPLRTNDDNKDWTRCSGSFNQFKWVFIDKDKIEIRTVRTDGSQSVAEVSHNNIFEPPIGLVIWNPAAGDVVTIRNKKAVAANQVAANQSTQESSQQNALPPGKPAAEKNTASNSNPPEPNPSDPNDWSSFPKVVPDDKGSTVVKFSLQQSCDVSMQLVNQQWQKIASIDFPKQPIGEIVKSIDMSKVPAGQYLLVIKGNGKLVRRYRVEVK